MVYGVPEIEQPKELGTGCLLSKQTQTPFPFQANFSAKERLELVHGDLCGPLSLPTPAGKRYIFLLVDDYSRTMWVHLLKSKDEALSAFKKFKVLVEKEARSSIRVFITDRGGEFTSKEFENYCADEGILRHLTAPYCPQQNGVVKRRNRTIIAMTQSLLKEKEMAQKFWGEAVRHTVYILNRMPTRALVGETPYEA